MLTVEAGVRSRQSARHPFTSPASMQSYADGVEPLVPEPRLPAGARSPPARASPSGMRSCPPGPCGRGTTRTRRCARSGWPACPTASLKLRCCTSSVTHWRISWHAGGALACVRRGRHGSGDGGERRGDVRRVGRAPWRPSTSVIRSGSTPGRALARASASSPSLHARAKRRPASSAAARLELVVELPVRAQSVGARRCRRRATTMPSHAFSPVVRARAARRTRRGCPRARARYCSHPAASSDRTPCARTTSAAMGCSSATRRRATIGTRRPAASCIASLPSATPRLHRSSAAAGPSRRTPRTGHAQGPQGRSSCPRGYHPAPPQPAKPAVPRRRQQEQVAARPL